MMKKKSKLIIASTLMISILILIVFISFNGKENKKNVANKTIVQDSNTKKDEIEKNSSDKKETGKNEEEIKNDSKEGAVNNSEEKENVSNNSELNKNNEANTEKTNSDNSEVNNSSAANSSNSTNDSNQNNSSNIVNNEKEPIKDAPSTEIKEEQPVEKYVTISITTNTILNNMDKVSAAKKDIIPSNGVILGEVKVKIEDGDTVFDILKKETRKNRIHMDFVESPVYGSAYIKGIANIYEFDAGDLSGWMYSVNGVFPGYGASNYKLENGDVIKWQYTCDLGRDLGNEF